MPLTKDDYKKIYLLLIAVKENQLVNPIEEWEVDVFDRRLIDKAELKKLIEKIKMLLSKEEINGADKEILLRKYHTFTAEVDENVYSKIEKAFNEKRIVEIEYFSMGKAETVKRKIEIYYKSRRYVIAFCHLRNAIRKFRTARIVSVKLTNERYEIPKDFDKNKYL